MSVFQVDSLQQNPCCPNGHLKNLSPKRLSTKRLVAQTSVDPLAPENDDPQKYYIILPLEVSCDVIYRCHLHCYSSRVRVVTLPHEPSVQIRNLDEICRQHSKMSPQHTAACERSVSGAENGEERTENGVSGSGAESGLNRPLKVRSRQHCVDLVTDILR